MAGSSSRSIGVTVTSTSGWVAASWAMTPPERVSEPVSLSGAPIASRSKRVAEGDAVDLRRARRPVTTTPVTTRTRADGDRLGARVAQLVDELLDALPVDRAADRDRHAGAADRIEPGVGADALEVGGDLVDRDVAARRGSRWSVASSSWSDRALAPELVVARVEVRHEDRQVLRRQLGEPARTRLRPELDDHEQAEDQRRPRRS